MSKSKSRITAMLVACISIVAMAVSPVVAKPLGASSTSSSPATAKPAVAKAKTTVKTATANKTKVLSRKRNTAGPGHGPTKTSYGYTTGTPTSYGVKAKGATQTSYGLTTGTKTSYGVKAKGATQTSYGLTTGTKTSYGVKAKGATQTSYGLTTGTKTSYGVSGGQKTSTGVMAKNCRRTPFGIACSDMRLKRDIVKVGRLDNGLDVYRFRYLWDDQIYVGVIAQQVQAIAPEAVLRGSDGYLRVDYNRLGLRMQTWDKWNAKYKFGSSMTP
jgi:Chaperone of endosialidase